LTFHKVEVSLQKVGYGRYYWDRNFWIKRDLVYSMWHGKQYSIAEIAGLKRLWVNDVCLAVFEEQPESILLDMYEEGKAIGQDTNSEVKSQIL
jgi:hypothetical protein